MRVAIVSVLLSAAWGCDGSCIRNSDCPGMLVCMAGVCAMPIVEMDADIPDGEPSDTGGLDASFDAALDAIEMDGAADPDAAGDAAEMDAGVADAGVMDAETTDANDLDVGTDGGLDGGSDAT